MASRSMPVVQTAGLSKTFRDFWRRPKVEAVKDLNLEIKPGEVFGLLGPNGSGKTTAIKMLLGLLFPTKGRISVFGRPPTDVSVKSRIGFLPEESYLYRFLVAHETLDYFGRLFRLPKRVRHDRAERLLDMVGLTHEAKRPIGEYSKGMARRIGLAQALINDPEFLILDEPTSGLDPIGARQIKDVIRELGSKGKTILLSSHILADVEDVCDRVYILYGGQQRASGDIGELLCNQNKTQLITPTLTEQTISKIRDLVRADVGNQDFSVSHPHDKLEDFFLRIVHEAQAANIKTSGARVGGEVPEFLKQAAQTETEEVVDSLLSAAIPEPVTQTIEPLEPHAEEQTPRDEVLDQLLGIPSPQEEEEEEQADADAADTTLNTDADSTQPVSQPDGQVSKTERHTPTADASIIDSLIQSSDDNPSEKKGDQQ